MSLNINAAVLKNISKVNLMDLLNSIIKDYSPVPISPISMLESNGVDSSPPSTVPTAFFNYKTEVSDQRSTSAEGDTATRSKKTHKTEQPDNGSSICAAASLSADILKNLSVAKGKERQNSISSSLTTLPFDGSVSVICDSDTAAKALQTQNDKRLKEQQLNENRRKKFKEYFGTSSDEDGLSSLSITATDLKQRTKKLRKSRIRLPAASTAELSPDSSSKDEAENESSPVDKVSAAAKPVVVAEDHSRISGNANSADPNVEQKRITENRLPKPPTYAGVLTPSTGGGRRIVKQLNRRESVVYSTLTSSSSDEENAYLDSCCEPNRREKTTCNKLDRNKTKVLKRIFKLKEDAATNQGQVVYNDQAKVRPQQRQRNLQLQQKLQQHIQSQTPSIYCSHFERNNGPMTYEAKLIEYAAKLKQAAEKAKSIFTQSTLYLEAVIYYLLAGATLQQQRATEANGWKIYEDALKLLKCTCIKFSNLHIIQSSETHDALKKVSILSMRCMAFIEFKLYEIEKISGHNIITQHSNTLLENKDMHSLRHLESLSSIQQLWKQTDRLVRNKKHSDFFTQLDKANCRLTLHSSVIEVFGYVQDSLEKLMVDRPIE